MNMKFVKGLVIGGLVTTGMVMLWQNDNMFIQQNDEKR